MSLLKVILLMSTLLGLVIGLLSPMPYIGGLAFFILLCFSAPIVLGMLLNIGVLKIDNISESAVLGGIVGFVSYLAFSVVYMPIVLILYKTFNYYVNYGVTLALTNANLFVIVTVSIFMGILSASINAFSGFLTYYLAEVFKNMNNK